jgi:dihydroorotase
MKTLIKSALILNKQSSHHGKKRDILIDKGVIEKISPNIVAPKTLEIKAKDLCVSSAWIDLRANFRDPGFEFKEDLASGIAAAAAGGFGTVVLMPSTLPIVNGKSQVEYIAAQTRNSNVRILIAGSLSDKMEGKQLSEMFDMHSSSAVAFTDDKQPVNTELMSRALEYSKNFNGLLYSFPFDPGVNPGGIVHEGKTSVAMGTKGLSSLSEELRLQRDIELLKYCGGRLHVSLISTSRSVELIRKAKKEGLLISCGIAAHQLNFVEEDLLNFDSNLKVLPPFRSAADVKALIAGLKDGTIDAICSDHTPEDTEHKSKEFEDAEYGISSIQTTFCAALDKLSGQLELERLVELFTSGPASVLKLEESAIEVGSKMSLTAFTTHENTTFSKESWLSKSENSPFFNATLKGKVVGLISTS